MASIVVILGAGATKSCGGPLTNEILPAMLKDGAMANPSAMLPELEIGASESRRYIKILSKLLEQAGNASLESAFKEHGSLCQSCGVKLRPLLVAPTHLKDYRNPHLVRVWYEAERVLRQASRAVFIGYSLPDDDVEVVYLLKRGLGHLPAAQITVVEYDISNPQLAGHPVGRRFRSLFGDIDWHPEGMSAWVSSLPLANSQAV